jgi:tRNA-2-methylthio-N6-dimethylallyladenosine synthase
MNAYDSERMAELLAPHGYRAVAAPEDADLVILNTCHIREKAAEKVYSDLGRLKPLKAAREGAGGAMTIAVAGCLAQAEGAEIGLRAPVVDIVVGPQAYHRLPELLARRARARGAIVDAEFAVEEKFDRLAAARGATGPTAYLTVQEGCDKFCAFCVVPYTRGPEVSRRAGDVIAEARRLVAGGVREITLLGQNVNAWRSAPPADAAFADIPPDTDGLWGLGRLCRALARVDGLARLRFTTSHPRDMDEDLFAAFAEEEKLMPYLHLPVQSGSDPILAAMNRGHTVADYLKIVARLRALRPDIALSSDFIVGFPGETTADFERTCDFVAEVSFAASFSFKYSRRPGTPAAAARGQVAEAEKDARLQRLQALLEGQRRAFNAAAVGARLPVLFEKAGRHAGQLVGRSPYLQSVHAGAPISMLGRIAEVVIEGTTPNALKGRLEGARADAGGEG